MAWVVVGCIRVGNRLRNIRIVWKVVEYIRVRCDPYGI